MNSFEKRAWLIRHPDRTFSQVLNEEELKELFISGEMKPEDEICPASGYWFSLQDVNEMRKHFGNMSMDGLFKKVKEEVTQERYAVTASITLTDEVRESLRQSVPTPSLVPVHEPLMVEDSLQQTSLLMKVLLAILTLAVLILLFVWFG